MECHLITYVTYNFICQIVVSTELRKEWTNEIQNILGCVSQKELIISDTNDATMAPNEPLDTCHVEDAPAVEVSKP